MSLPWKIIDNVKKHQNGWTGTIEIRGANDEAICSIFPFAGHGGVGIDVARQNAALIVQSVNRAAGIEESKP